MHIVYVGPLSSKILVTYPTALDLEVYRGWDVLLKDVFIIGRIVTEHIVMGHLEAWHILYH
jgi:hypothetical protein